MDRLTDESEITQPTHYTGRGGIEPINFIVSNGMDFLEGNVVKYVFRWRLKNGVQDLHKARQYLQWLIEREEDASCKVLLDS